MVLPPQCADLRSAVGGLEDGGARHHDIGTSLSAESGGLHIDPSIHLDQETKSQLRADPIGIADLAEHVVHEGLAAESRLDRHDQENIKASKELSGLIEGGARLDGEARFLAGGAHGVQRDARIVVGLEVRGHGRNSGNAHELRDVAVGTLDHEMDIEREARVASGSFHDRLTEGNVRDEVPIHHVAMDPIGARGRHALDLIPQATEVTGEN